MIELLWNDGKRIAGNSWREAEDSLRASQWRPFKSRTEFRKEMRRRAFLWCGHRVYAYGTSQQFLRMLEKSGMFSVFES